MKNLFSKIKTDTLNKKLENSLSNKIQDWGEKIVKELDDFSAKSPDEQRQILLDTIEKGKNLTTSPKESPEDSEAESDTEESTNNKTTPATGAYLVCDGAMCSCDQGTIPMLRIPIDSHKKYYANDKLAATIKDSNLPKPFFVKCNLKSPPGDVSCTYTKADWVIKKGEGHPTAGGTDVLIDNGEITCKIGGKITIINHGQQTTVSSKDIGGFSVDVALAINSLMPFDTILEEGQEQEEMTIPSIKYIEYNGTLSNGKTAITERASQRFNFKAVINVPAEPKNKNEPKKLKGDPRLVSWAVLKKGESPGNWKIFPSYGDVISLTFTEGGTYIILAYGKRPATINENDLIKFDKEKWDKNCYFEFEVIKDNPITHLVVNDLKVKESLTIIKGNTCTIKPKTQLPLTDEESNSLIMEIRNGSNKAFEHEQKGDTEYMLPTDQETEYQIYTYYEGSVRPKPVKISIIENEIDNFLLKIYPTNRYVRHGEEVSFRADLKNKDNINDEKIHWLVNGVEKSTGQDFTFKFPADKTKDTDYKIEVYYKNLLSSKKTCSRTLTAKQNSVNKINVSNVNSDKCAYIDQSYDIKAVTVIPYNKVLDKPIRWKIIFVPSSDETVKKGDLVATLYTKQYPSKEMRQYSFEFEAEDGIQFIPKKAGSYTIVTVFNSGTATYPLTVKKAQVKAWRFVSTNGWKLDRLGMNQAFNVELEIEGCVNQELSLSLYIESTWFGGSKEVSLGKHKTDQLGKIPVVTVGKDHEFWDEVRVLVKGNLSRHDIKQVSLVVSGNVSEFEGKYKLVEDMKLYLPPAKGDMIVPIVKMNQFRIYEARFADADNNKLLKIVKYGEPVKAQVRILKGYSYYKGNYYNDKIWFTLVENVKTELFNFKNTRDKKIEGYINVEKSLVDGEDIVEFEISTEKLGKDTHVNDKGNEFNPRLFYFIINYMQGGSLVDYTYPRTLSDLRNDETIIELEVHDGKNDDEIDKRNEKKIKDTGKDDKFDYFNQLKVAQNTLLNQSLEKKAMAIIGEELMPANAANCEGKYCITKANYDKYPNVSKENVGRLIQEINIRLTGFGGNVPTTEFDSATQSAIRQFQRDYMEIIPTGRICGNLLKAIDEFSNDKKYDIPFDKLKCSCTESKWKAPQGYTACSGFGNGLVHSNDNPAKAGVEYSGMHKSLLFIFKAMLFYIDKIGYPCKYDHISSGYRCWTDNKDASRHDEKKIRNTTNHMGTALDIQFKFEANKSYDDIRKDIFCRYMGAPLKRANGKAFGWVRNKVGLESNADGAKTWIHVDVREFHDYKSDSFFIKDKNELTSQSLVSLANELGFRYMCNCNGIVQQAQNLVTTEECVGCKVLLNTYDGKNREAFYREFGLKIINDFSRRFPGTNKFKALYIISQRRQENGFRLKVLGNNPMNLKCEGDLGYTDKVETSECQDNKNVKIMDNFGNFSSEEAGMDKYFERLNSLWPFAESALLDEGNDINDFVAGLEDEGKYKYGVYATGQSGNGLTGPEQYKKAVVEVFGYVKKDYIKWYECKLSCANHASDKEQIKKDLELIKSLK